jgi:nucleoside-diphosphate-sugar epimerase
MKQVMSSSIGKILITGATGYIGTNLCDHLWQKGYSIKRVGRELKFKPDYEQITDVYNPKAWSNLLDDIDIVVHLAANAHNKKSSDINYFLETNFALDSALISAIKSSKVKKLINMSSIGVNGENSKLKPFHCDLSPKPMKPYAVVKAQSENLFTTTLYETEVELVNIRPPMVYGVNAPGNFSRLIRLAQMSFPNIFGKIENERHFIAIENLVSFVELCCYHPAAANQTFTIADPEAVSTFQMYRSLLMAVGNQAKTLNISPILLRSLLRLYGGEDLVNSLTGNLLVDTLKANQVLNWRAPVKNIIDYKFDLNDLEMI